MPDLKFRRALLVIAAGIACAGKERIRESSDASVVDAAVATGRFESVFQNTSLGTIARANNRYFGAAVVSRHLIADTAYAALVGRETNVVVPDWELKWGTLRRKRNSYDFSGADAIAKFARDRGLGLRGHTLVWYQDLPAWFDSVASPTTADSLLRDHIQTVVSRYRGQIASWDVVNEVLDPDSERPDGLRDSPWLRLLGPGYVAEAFRLAHIADPAAQLVFNETGLEYHSRRSAKHRRATLQLLRSLKAAGVPVNALGIQGHLRPAAGQIRAESLDPFIDSVSALGLRVIVTELDVTDRPFPADVEIRDSLVADAYESFLRIVLRHSAVEGVMTWSLSDKYSWIQRFYPRLDGLPARPAPFDASFQRKTAWSSIAKALVQAHSSPH